MSLSERLIWCECASDRWCSPTIERCFSKRNSFRRKSVVWCRLSLCECWRAMSLGKSKSPSAITSSLNWWQSNPALHWKHHFSHKWSAALLFFCHSSATNWEKQWLEREICSCQVTFPFNIHTKTTGSRGRFFFQMNHFWKSNVLLSVSTIDHLRIHIKLTIQTNSPTTTTNNFALFVCQNKNTHFSSEFNAHSNDVLWKNVGGCKDRLAISSPLRETTNTQSLRQQMAACEVTFYKWLNVGRVNLQAHSSSYVNSATITKEKAKAASEGQSINEQITDKQMSNLAASLRAPYKIRRIFSFFSNWTTRNSFRFSISWKSIVDFPSNRSRK